jgi:hypothetical protein
MARSDEQKEKLGRNCIFPHSAIIKCERYNIKD